MTPAGIDSATFEFVAQHLNISATAVRFEYWSPSKLYIGFCFVPHG